MYINIIYNIIIESWPTVTMLISFICLINTMISIIAPGLLFIDYDEEKDK